MWQGEGECDRHCCVSICWMGRYKMRFLSVFLLCKTFCFRGEKFGLSRRQPLRLGVEITLGCRGGNPYGFAGDGGGDLREWEHTVVRKGRSEDGYCRYNRW